MGSSPAAGVARPAHSLQHVTFRLHQTTVCAPLHLRACCLLPISLSLLPPAGLAHPSALPPSAPDMEMEVTFLPGLENLGERLLAKKREEEARKGETVWEAYMRRKR